MITGPKQLIAPKSEMDCKGSGTTLRIFTALSALTEGRCVLTGNPSLQARPMTELLNALGQLGVSASSIQGDGKPPVEVKSQGLVGGTVRIRGDVSSQYISGLLFACSKAENETRIELTTNLESQPYVEMTIEVMEHFNATAEPSEHWNQILVSGQQNYKETNYKVPGDYSSAAFLLVAGALTGRVSVTGLDTNSKQGDSEIISLLQRMGVSVNISEDSYTVDYSEPLSLDIDVSDTPDLVPVLAVLSSQAIGRTRILNASRLRLKESDRLATTTAELRKMGAQIDTTDDGIIIEGPTPLHGAVIDSHQDHRIAMACSIAGLIAKGPTIIQGIECITKSYPQFVEHLLSLGANVELEQKNMERRMRE